MRNYQRGQILLIVVLVTTVVLTVGMSVASRTITDIRTSTQQESSQRAFSAAEAGIEKSLQNLSDSSGKFESNNSSYKATITDVSGKEYLLNNGIPILKDEAADLWLSSYPDYSSPWSGTLTIYWGNSTDRCSTSELSNSMAALDIVLLFGSKDSPQLAHYPVDPCSPLNSSAGYSSSPRTNYNNFQQIAAGGGTVSGRRFAFKRTISVTSGLLLRIIPLYAPTSVGASVCDSCQAFPFQGKTITSVGKSSNTERKIVGFQENPKIPLQIFPYILFSAK